jgi:MFS transporter, DHA2 family, multidrug resistance protein
MNVLDTSIANVSIPTISGDLGVSSSQGTWVITSFAVANAITVPLTGWLTQRLVKCVWFLTSTLLFVLASWLCGFASSLEALIAFRVLQGAVASPMIPLSQALMLSIFLKAKAGMALAVWSMTTLVAPVAGPLLGGWISDNYTWPWIFYINVPVGLLAAWISWRIYRHRESPTRQLPIDKMGLFLLVLWVGALQIMLDKGKELDWFASPLILGLAVVAFVAFIFFLIWELTDAHPVVDLRLFKERNFLVGSLTLAIAYGVFFGNVVLLPLWLQSTMSYTATYAGIVTAPVGILALLLTPIVGKMLATRDPRQIATVAFIIFELVCFMRSGFNTQTDMRTLIVPTIIQGAAMAIFFVPLTSITLSSLDPRRLGSVELCPADSRRIRHLDRHDRLGKPRHPTSCTTDRSRYALTTRLRSRLEHLAKWCGSDRESIAHGARRVDQYPSVHLIGAGCVLCVGGNLYLADWCRMVRLPQIGSGRKQRRSSGRRALKRYPPTLSEAIRPP